MRRKDPLKYKKGAVGGGFCQMWSLFYLEMCLKYPTKSGEELNKKATDELNSMGLPRFVEHIIKYTEALNKAVAKMLDKDVKITSKDLRKKPFLKQEIRQIFNKMVKEYLVRNRPVKLLSDTTQVARLKEKSLILHKALQENAGVILSSKGLKKKQAEKEGAKIQAQIIEINKGLEEIEQEMTGSGIPEEVESVFSKLSKDKATVSFYNYVKKHSKDTNVGLYFIQQMYPKWLKSKEAKAIVAEMANAPTAPTAPTLEISEVAEKKGRKKLTETERLAKKKAYDAKRHAEKLKEEGKPARKKLTEAERKAKRAEYDAKRRVKGGNIPMNGVIYDYENDSDYESSDCGCN
jgi:hypothetical protein